jgi:hypothetical protein
MKLFLFLLASLVANAAGPVVSAWILSRPVDNAELRKSLPDVHEVSVQDDFVEVRSAGLSSMSLGPFQNPPAGDAAVRDLHVRIPRKPVRQDGPTQRLGPGIMGVFLNGVPLYDRFAEASYLGRNMWHFKMVALNDPTHPTSLGVLQPMIANKLAHSPLLGFALDGFPIYGPGAFTNADGIGGFLSTDDLNDIVFPYFMTDRFRGKLPDVVEHAPGTQLEFAHGTLETGKPVELRFAFPGVKAMEIVHERPLHLTVVSSDLKFFNRIHPQWKLGDWYSVDVTFSRPGKHRLFVQFTLPGARERVETFDVVVTGKGKTEHQTPPTAATLRKPANMRTGGDVPFTVQLNGQPIEPYLGSWGHFVFLDQGLGNFIHTSPADNAGACAVAPGRRPHCGLSRV